MERQYFAYILASKRNGTLYTGMTIDLIRRVYEHRNGLIEGFSKQYDVHNLVYYEVHRTPGEAIKREKQIRKWNRQWKIEVIEKENPLWDDLYNNILPG